MQKFADYDTTQVNEFGEYERLKLGGHICKILEVKIEKLTTKEGKDFEQLSLKIDIAEPDEQAGFYNRKFVQDAQIDALKAKWKGFYKLTIPNDSSEEFIKTNFKTLVTSIEKSNPGYVWNWEENTLVGKVFGGVFGIEEFTNLDGNLVSFTRCRFVRSTEKIFESPIPKVRLADKTTMDYEEYLAKKKNGNTNTNNSNSSLSQIDDNSDLPF